MADSDLDGRRRTHAEPDDIGLLDPQVVQQGGAVVGHPLVRDRPVDIGGAAVALEIGDDHLAGRYQPGQQGAELTGRHVRPVQEQDGRRVRRLAVDLVVHVEAVRRGVTGRCGPTLRAGGCGSRGVGHCSSCRIGCTPRIGLGLGPQGNRHGRGGGGNASQKSSAEHLSKPLDRNAHGRTGSDSTQDILVADVRRET